MPMTAANGDALATLVDALAQRFSAQGLVTERFDTHISTVLLAGAHAYKFKKPVDFGFLDFSTLERRRHYCEVELTLNRRYAPDLYLDVLPVTAAGSLDGDGPAVEFALRMRRFATDDRLDRALARGSVRSEDITAIAQMLAHTHQRAGSAPLPGDFGAPTLVRSQLLSGLEVLAGVSTDPVGLRETLDARCAARVAALEDRVQGGHIRDCHGDLHLTNIMRHAGHWQPFDCIEFSDELRYIDTASDLAFLLMDLDVREHGIYANQLLNDYLAASGDYGLLAVLDLYLVYRTIVRAKVACLGTAEADQRARASRHLDLARRYLAARPAPALSITHGVSGSGKSWVATRIAGARGFVHIRSDHERRRLAGLAAGATSHSELGAGLYAVQQTEATYARLAHLAGAILRLGYSVIVDATFLQARQRDRFRELARETGAHFTILDCEASRPVLEARLRARAADGRDPSEATPAVMARQLETRQALSGYERRLAIRSVELEDDAAVMRLPGGDRVARRGA
jgi:uncharacterized protein